MKKRPSIALALLMCGLFTVTAASTSFAAASQRPAGQAAPPATAPAPTPEKAPAPAPVTPQANAPAPAAAPTASPTAAAKTPPSAPAIPPGVATPPGYVIGPEDVLAVIVWRENDMSVDATVRPDGMITVPVINDVAAAGLTPQQLRDRLTEVAAKYVADPNITVVVKAINSRNVYITGQVLKPGRYPLAVASTVLQLIATAGGLAEYADAENVRIVRIENGRSSSLRFNYQDVARGRAMEQNIELKPGDTIVVP